MIGRITPQAAGMPEQAINAFMDTLRRNEINMHSLLLLRGNDIFFERYWAPFTAETPHRMYSVTKSFVAIAIGCLLDEGKLALDDPIIKYFPDKLPEKVSPLLAGQTIRHMLMMSTCFAGINWFQPNMTDRTAYYFAQKPVKPAGTLFDYDSTGSYILGVLVERLSGMPLLDYLKRKILDHLGGFENAQLLLTPDGTAWGDSALICTPRALMNFARFVMNLGSWQGKRLLNAEYLKEATRSQTSNDLECRTGYNRFGYGYQIWMTEQNGFAFNGMGGQFAICVPEKDFILVCTGDNQFNDSAAATVFRAAFDCLVDSLPGARASAAAEESLELSVAHGSAESDFSHEIDGVEFICDPNPMGIARFHLEFCGENSCFVYQNAQGCKRLSFGMKRNHFGKFPQFGYSDDRGNVHALTDFRYDCAASAGWIEPQKLQLRVQIIDRYFGSLVITFGFSGKDVVGIRMTKHAEDFLGEYDGWIAARRMSAV